MRGLKKIVGFILTAIIITSLLPQTFAHAAEEIIIKADGKILPCNEPIRVENGELMVPIRAVAEAYKKTVGWENGINMVKITGGATNCSMVIGNKYASFNDGAKVEEFEAAPQIYNGTAYASAELVAKACDVEYTYDSVLSVASFVSKEYSEILAAAASADDEYATRYLKPIADAKVEGGSSADTNFGTQTTLQVKYQTANDTQTFDRDAYIKFDISEIKNWDFGKHGGVTFMIKVNSVDISGRTVNIYIYETDTNWEEDTITLNNQPKRGELLAIAQAKKGSVLTLDLTEYATNLYKSGKKLISLKLEAEETNEPMGVHFVSRENTTSQPSLQFTYGTMTYPSIEGFGKGIDPNEWALQMIEKSNAVKYQDIKDTINEQPKPAKKTINASESARVQAGIYRNVNYEEQLICKYLGPKNSLTRRGFIKFDLSALGGMLVSDATFRILCTNVDSAQLGYDIFVKSVANNDWKSNTLTWANQPRFDDTLGRFTLTAKNKWYECDITNFINEKIMNGETTISIGLEDNGGRGTTFAASDTKNPPQIVLMPAAETNIHPEDWAMSAAICSPLTMDAPFTETPTRVVDTLSGYTQVDEPPAMCPEYGGLLDKTADATGFFHTTKIDDRWWIVDPHGHLMLFIGVDGVSMANIQKFVDANYDSVEQWAKEATTDLRSWGFNVGNSWKDFEPTLPPLKFAQAWTVGCMGNYAQEYTGRWEQQTGHVGFADNNTIPVFDPDFEDWADYFMKKHTAQIAGEESFVGFFSDNELPHQKDMLRRYLTLDPTEPYCAYSHATAWEWFRQATGKHKPTIDDITEELNDDWNDFIYDRYYQVVYNAFRKYDKDHMYLGFRMMDQGENLYQRGIIRATGRYADVMAINLYNHWTPRMGMLNNFYEWSGKPMWVTEWYARMERRGGAGWVVETDEDKAMFYQNYTLRLLESKTCIGWDWFMYHSSGLSNGIIGNNPDDPTKPTETFKKSFTQLNRNVYNLIDFFDNRE